MSDTESETTYQITNYEDLNCAIYRVLNNSCSCGRCEMFCDDCLGIKNYYGSILRSKLPFEIGKVVASNFRCKQCQKMIDVINTAPNFNRCSLFEIKLFFSTELNQFPKYEIIKNEILKGSEWFDKYDNNVGGFRNHHKLLGFYDSLYDYEELIYWLKRYKNIEERNVLYQVLFKIICHFEDKESNNILYGDGFGFSLLEYVNDLFFFGGK